jgi:hypothetical protein
VLFCLELPLCIWCTLCTCAHSWYHGTVVVCSSACQWYMQMVGSDEATAPSMQARSESRVTWPPHERIAVKTAVVHWQCKHHAAAMFAYSCCCNTAHASGGCKSVPKQSSASRIASSRITWVWGVQGSCFCQNDDHMRHVMSSVLGCRAPSQLATNLALPGVPNTSAFPLNGRCIQMCHVSCLVVLLRTCSCWIQPIHEHQQASTVPLVGVAA